MTSPSQADQPFTLAFVGYADAATSARAAAYEDAVLPLLADHGAQLVYRGRRAAGRDPSLPIEVHLIRFPDRRALESFLGDERRTALIEEFGKVFTTAHAVVVDTVAGTLAETT